MQKFNFLFKIILFLNILFLGFVSVQAQVVQPSPDQSQYMQPSTTGSAPVDTGFVTTVPTSTTPIDTSSVGTAPVYTPPVDTGSVTVPVTTTPVDTSSAGAAPVYTPPIDASSVSTASAPAGVQSTTPMPSDQTQNAQVSAPVVAPVYTPTVDTSSDAAVPVFTPSAGAAPSATVQATKAAAVPVSTASVATAPVYTTVASAQQPTAPSTSAPVATVATLTAAQTVTPVVSTTTQTTGTQATTTSLTTTQASTTPSSAILASFVTALSVATTPSAINAIVNMQTYNSVTYLVDYPSGSNSIFSKIAGFFPNGVTNQTGQALIDLQTLLNNSNLNNFLSPSEQATISSWLTNLTNASTLAVKSMFTTALASASTPSTVNTVVNTQAYNSVKYLVDYPSTSNSIFTKIRGFFNANGTTNQTGQAIIDLQTLLSNSNLNNFLTSTEQVVVATWLTNLTNTMSSVITKIQSAFTTVLANATTPSAINTVVNSYASTSGTTSSSVSYLIDYPSTTNSIFTKIQGFFNSSGVPTQTGQALIDLQTLLNNTNLNNLLSATEQQTVAIWLANVNTTVATVSAIDTTVQNTISSAMGNSTISSQVTALNSVAKTYNNTTVAYATQVAFAAAIMSVGGSYINTNLSALTTFYNTIKAKTTLAATDKSNIKTTIAPYITSIGGNISNFSTLLANALKTNLLTGPVSTAGTQLNFINTTLIPAVNMLVYLNGKSS